MGRHLEDVTLAGLLALLNLADLLADADERVDEAVKLLLALALGGLDHECVGDGPAHGRRVEAVVLKALGDVDSLDARGCAEGPRVEDELVRATAVLVGVEDLVVRLKAGEDVVRVEDGGLGGEAQTVVAHQGVDTGAAVGGAGNHGLLSLGGAAREVGAEVLLDADGPDTGTTATMGNAESLVEVKMADVGADLAGRADTNLGVHVGAVHVDLAAVLVNKVAGLLDARLKDSVSARIGDHKGAKLVGVLLAFGLQVLNVQVTGLLVAFDGDNAHAGHGGRSRVGTVGRDRDQADVALLAWLLFEVLADDTQTGELTLSAGIGLQGDGVHGGNALELLRQTLNQSGVALELTRGSVGMDRGEARERDQSHLGRAVQLHRAGSEGNHGVNEGQILGLKVVDVAEDLRLAAVGVEDGLRDVLGKSAVGLARDLRGLGTRGAAENSGDGVKHLFVDVLVDTNANITVSIVTEAQASLLGLGQDVLRAVAGLDDDGVEQDLAIWASTALLGFQASGLGNGLNATSKADQPRSNLLQTLGAMVDGEQCSHVGQESLRSANVAGGLLAADVLLASLQSQSQGSTTGAGLDLLLSLGGADVEDLNLDAESLSSASQNGNRLGVNQMRDNESLARSLGARGRKSVH
ncbi:hypothetical protein Ct61P_14370 [Colletotrichum tofieldiae]|nr:hypothetical protein Ct61P_14370 [Colletotrichum tofieldiae]